MTGFGEAHDEHPALVVSAEVRTINSRYFKLSYRSSDGFAALEPLVESIARQFFKRGNVQIQLRVKQAASAEDYTINGAVLEGYRQQLAALASDQRTAANADNVPLATMLALPGVVQESPQSRVDPQRDWPAIETTLTRACRAAAEMRQQEGQVMADDLSRNCQQVEDRLTSVEERAPLVVSNYRQRLAERVTAALSELDVKLETADLIREVSLFADRSDISEEIVRLKSHLAQFEQTVALPESSGRRLEFICQEMGREVNTIGSKANDAEIAKDVVEMKTALERIREQIQNVE